MTPRRRRVTTANVLDRHKADVQYSVGGLTIGIGGVQASDAANVAAAILNAVRELRQHYPELDPELSPIHGGLAEMQEESDEGHFVVPPEGKKVVGFR